MDLAIPKQGMGVSVHESRLTAAPTWPPPLLCWGIFERCFMQHATAPNEQPIRLATTPDDLPYLPGPQDLMLLLGVSENGLASLIKAGAIPAPVIKSGRIRRWNKAQVLAALGGAV